MSGGEGALEQLAAGLVRLDREPVWEPRLRAAGVLALIDPSDPGLPLLLLERDRGLREHPGQVGLPGGSHDAADGPLWRTALREAEEELGVPGSAVRPLGYGLPVEVRHSGFLMAPLVASLRHHFTPRLQAAEVESCFWMPLHSAAVQVVNREVSTHLGRLIAPGYLYQGHFVWGATGLVVDDLRRRLGQPIAGRPPTT
ncbi:MAG: NUDIX hydrolase [Candidatus Dormibacteria bacterium]